MKKTSHTLYEPAREPFVDIVASGKAQARIVIPRNSTFLNEFAAAELQGFVERISGARLAIVKEGNGAGLYSFFLGRTQKAAVARQRRARPLGASGARIEPDESLMGRDGFVLRSVPGGLVILGGNDRGTLFGVYELLERYFDVRWFMPGEIGEYVPRRRSLRMGSVNLVFRPAFDTRWVGRGQWALCQRMNVSVTAKEQDVGIKWKWNFHTFRRLIPPEKYYASHPEYFALVGGQRSVTESRTQGNQLCTSNPDLIGEVAHNLIAVLDKEPDTEIVTLSPNDGGGFCECEKCRALDEPGRDWFARYSRRLALFNNEVARMVKKKHPEVLIKVGAYNGYARPPLDADWRPEGNLFFQLCHLNFCHNHPLGSKMCKQGVTYEPSERFQPNQEFCEILDRWLALSPRLYLYEYYAIQGMRRAGLAWPLVHTIRSDIPYYRDRGVEGFYTQVFEDTWHRHSLNYYVAAKLCWNPDLDVDLLLQDYFEKCYGPAAEVMKEYFMTMEQSMETWNGCASYGLYGVRGLKDIGPKIFTPRVMQHMGACLTEAERVSGDDPTLGERVGMVRQMYEETSEELARP
jgi:hypothetical protein